jgi:hypothetical protein
MSIIRRLVSTYALRIALALGVLAGAQDASAGGSFRCGNRLVSHGSSSFDVVRRCGGPAFRSFSIDYVTVRLRHGVEVLRAVPVEVWTYNLGPRQFLRFLTFRNNRLVHVGEGDYGW